MQARSPQRLERVPGSIDGHEKDWVRACKDGKPASTNFDYAGPLSEVALMGNLAVRFPNRVLLWDGEKMNVTNEPAADAHVRRQYREGWSLVRESQSREKPVRGIPRDGSVFMLVCFRFE